MKYFVPAVWAACFVLLSSSIPASVAAAPQDARPSLPPPASYQFALGKLLAVEGSVNDALAAFEEAERMAPDSPETAYVLVEHAQLLARMAQYARNPSMRDESLRRAAEKVTAARRLAPDTILQFRFHRHNPFHATCHGPGSARDRYSP